MNRTLRALLCVLALGLIVAPAALAAPDQESIFEDDAQLLQSGAGVRERTLDEFSSLGVDVIRSLALWRSVAPSPDASRRPSGFDAKDPAAYPASAWDPYDDLVRGAHARGMAVLFSPAGPVPAWGQARSCRGVSARLRRACKPDPKAYGAFVQALATRYSGSYSDENQGGGVLPRVDRWSIWNEPNQPGWLNPQQTTKRGRTIPSAAILYRKLAVSAIAALRRTDHGSDQILLGETAPIGLRSGSLAGRAIPPQDFIAALFCVDGHGKRLSGSRAGAVGCRRVTKFRVSGFAHHPYSRGGSQPPLSRPNRGEITIASSSRLKALLSAGARSGAIPRGLPIWYTEFGFQTDPPDHFFGVAPKLQAAYLNQSDYIAYKDPRILSVAQYLLVDAPNVASFQTGIRDRDGVAKESYNAYRVALWAAKGPGSQTTIYGQIRPAVPGSHEFVRIERSDSEDGPFDVVLQTEVTSDKGQFLVTVDQSGGYWRLVWPPSDGSATLTSRVAKPGKR